MAYNPFDFFRKNQKIFFAVLTIIVMFMFVLSFGQGDFFQWFPQWLSGMKSTGEVMAKVGGSSVRESDLARVNSQRLLANQYMNAAAERQGAALAEQSRNNRTKISQETQQAISSATLAYQILNFQLTQGRGGPDSLEQLKRALHQARAELATVMNRPNLKAEDKTGVETEMKQFHLQLHRLAQLEAGGRRGESMVYFTGAPNRTMKDQMEFVLWLKKADQLGIRFTEEDVNRLVDAEFPDVPEKDLKAITADALSASARRRTEGDLTTALADEFRVRAAQTAVLGPAEVRFAGSTTPVPYDYFDFYRKETSPTQYTFLSIPVEPFMAQVQGEPSEQELKRIFTDAKGIDPDPMNPKPGIREPRKIKVQWAEVTGREPYYDAKTDEKMKGLVAARKVAATPDAGAVLGVAGTHPAAFGDIKYDEYKQTQTSIARLWAESMSNPGLPRISLKGQTSLTPLASVLGGAIEVDSRFTLGPPLRPLADPSAKLADASLARPQNAGALAGLFGGSFSTAGSLMTAPVILTQAAYTAEQEQRLITGLQGLVVPTLPGAATAVLDPLGAELSVFAGLPQPLPQAQVQPMLDQFTKNELRYKVAVDDVREFEKKLTETMKQADQTAAVKQAAEQVAAFIKERGLKTDGSNQLRDIHTIADEPALAPLVPKSGMADRLLGVFTNPSQKSDFGRTLFLTIKRNPLDPRGQGQIVPAVGLYNLVSYPPTADNQYSLGEVTPLLLTWRTEETKADAPREFNDPLVKAKCEQIWKRGKARELARKAADDILAEVKKAGESGPVVNIKLTEALAALKAKFPNPAEQSKFKLIDKREYSVAQLVPSAMNEFSRPGQPVPLRPFGLTQGDDFVYPTAKMNEELLANRDKPVGTGIVLADFPETTLYAAVVTAKDEASPLAFRRTVYAAEHSPFGAMGGMGDARETVEARYAADSRKAARERAVSLLKAEFGYADENPELEKKASETSEF